MCKNGLIKATIFHLGRTHPKHFILGVRIPHLNTASFKISETVVGRSKNSNETLSWSTFLMYIV